MNSFILFFKKEITELIKTVKGVVLAVVFLLIAITSPIITKLTPEILKWAGIDGAGEEFAALMALIPEPNSMMSYAQFFENFNMMGLLAVIIVFAGIVANEKSRSTAAYILTKNISRTQFILSKFAASVVFVFVSLVIMISVQILYTNILFDDNLIELKNVLIFSALLFLYLIFILTFVLFSSAVSKSITPATFIAFLIFIAFNIVGAIPRIGKYLPPAVNNFGIITQQTSVGDILPNIIVTVLCSVAFVFLSVKLFNRQEL